jgi:hypothetical protein
MSWTRQKLTGILIGLPLLAVITWGLVYLRDTRRLSRDTRVVVRVSPDLVDELTRDRITEQFPIEEELAGAEFTGQSTATGHIGVRVEPASDSATLAIEVTGVTKDEVTGVRPPVTFAGTGAGAFQAVQRIRFDGRQFHPLEPEVQATHETRIDSVEPLPGTPFGPAIRLVAARTARQTLPAVDAAFCDRIESIIAERLTQVVDATVERLNHTNQFDETIAMLHPEADDWRITLASSPEFVQAALVPEGGVPPQLPPDAPDPDGIEVWLRLTRTERGAVRIARRWNVAHRLLRRYLPEHEAATVAQNLEVDRVGPWMRLQVGAEASRRLRRGAIDRSSQAG